MKKLNLIILSAFFIGFGFGQNQADYATTTDFLNMFLSHISKDIPDSYKYIKLNFKISTGTILYENLQKGVYLGVIKNANIYIKENQKITYDFVNKFIQKAFYKNFFVEGTGYVDKNKLENIINLLPTYYDLKYPKANVTYIKNSYKVENIDNFWILDDVYQKLKNFHYDGENFDDNTLMQGAIKGMVEATKDKFSVYFPPSEAKNFNDELNGSFEGIGAYVEMIKPGIVQIVSPLPGSPAENAGLKASDIIKKVDGVEITDKMSLTEVVSKIKGPAGTKVTLTIVRGSDTFDVQITRQKIVIKFVEGKVFPNNDYLIKINMFGQGVSKEFEDALKLMPSNTNKLIIDLRNNPGGSLDEVVNILGFFVQSGEVVVNVKYKNLSQDYISNQITNYNLQNKKIIFLVNGGTASASEIMVATVKDYLPNVKVIGEKTFGKGSVQLLEQYTDGSSLKYTIAKWFSGKTQTSVDEVGIKPDIELKLDENQLKNQIDNQLEYAKNFNW